MYCSESPSVYSDLWNNQKRREENGGTLQTHSIHQSAFILGLPFLLSSEFHSERHLPCVCSFSFFFAQQHLTISWSWHRLQCYRDFVVPNVQKMQMSNTYGTKWTEGTSASSLFPLLMSILESLGFLTVDSRVFTTTPSIDQFVGSAQGSILMCANDFILFFSHLI